MKSVLEAWLSKFFFFTWPKKDSFALQNVCLGRGFCVLICYVYFGEVGGLYTCLYANVSVCARARWFINIYTFECWFLLGVCLCVLVYVIVCV